MKKGYLSILTAVVLVLSTLYVPFAAVFAASSLVINGPSNNSFIEQNACSVTWTGSSDLDPNGYKLTVTDITAGSSLLNKVVDGPRTCASGTTVQPTNIKKGHSYRIDLENDKNGVKLASATSNFTVLAPDFSKENIIFSDSTLQSGWNNGTVPNIAPSDTVYMLRFSWNHNNIQHLDTANNGTHIIVQVKDLTTNSTTPVWFEDMSTITDNCDFTIDNNLSGNQPKNQLQHNNVISTLIRGHEYSVQCFTIANVSQSLSSYSDYTTNYSNQNDYPVSMSNILDFYYFGTGTQQGSTATLNSSGPEIKINVHDALLNNFPSFDSDNNPDKTKVYLDKFATPQILGQQANMDVQIQSKDGNSISKEQYQYIKVDNASVNPTFPGDNTNWTDINNQTTSKLYPDMDQSKNGYITIMHYNYAGKTTSGCPREQSFGNPVNTNVLFQEARAGVNPYDSNNNYLRTSDIGIYNENSGQGANAFVRNDSSSGVTKNNTIYYSGTADTNSSIYINNKWYKNQYGTWKAMKMWGYIKPDKTGHYRLGAYSDDGAYGYIIQDGQPKVFVNDWSIAGPSNRDAACDGSNCVGDLTLTAGTVYPIYMEWYEGNPTQGAFEPVYYYNGNSSIADGSVDSTSYYTTSWSGTKTKNTGYAINTYKPIPQSWFYPSTNPNPGTSPSAYFGDSSGIPFNPQPDGTYYIAIKGQTGNNLTEGLYGPFVVDTTKPLIQNIDVHTDNSNDSKIAKIGNTVYISFDSSETLKNIPKVTIDGTAVTVTQSGNHYTASYNISQALNSGPVDVIISDYSDLSGNPGDMAEDTSVNFATAIGLNAQKTTATSTELHWNPISNLTNITLKESVDGGKTWSTISSTISTGATSYTVNGLNPNSVYRFSINVTGNNNYKDSDFVDVKTLSKQIILSDSNVTSTSADFQWQKPTGATAVAMYVSSDNGSTWTQIGGNIDISASSVTISNLTPNTSYQFKLVVTGGQNEGDSNIVTLMTASQKISGIDLINTATNSSVKNQTVSLDPSGAASVKINPVISPSNATRKDLTWTASDPTAVSFTTNPDGTVTVTLLKYTNTPIVITVSANDGSGTTASFTIQPVKYVTGVSVNPSSATINVGQMIQINAAITPTDASNKSVTYVSNAPGVATVDAAGLVTGKAPGTAVITVTTADGGKTATFTVTVKQPATSIDLINTGTNQSVNNTSVELNYPDNKSIIIDPKIGPANSTTQKQDLIWAVSSGDSTAVSIVKNADGTVTVTLIKDTNQPITITVTTNDGGSATASFTIDPVKHVTGITVNPSTATINVGQTVQITPSVAPSDAANRAVNYVSNAPGVATVNAAGLVTGNAPGTAIITVTTADGSKTATCTVTVNQPATSIDLINTKTNQSVNNTQVGLSYADKESIIIDPKIGPANSTTQKQDLIWTPSDSTAVSIVKNPDGTVTITLIKDIDQSITITVTTKDGGTASASFTIQPVKHVTGVTVNPDSATINVKDTLNIAPNVTVAPSNASNKSVTYVSDTPGVATVDATTGLVTGIATGTAIITVTTADGGKTATFTVIVKQPLKTISLGPDPLNLNLTNNTTYTGLPGELQFNPTDATDKNVTWTSADPTIATVDANTGEVTAKKNGTTTITAKAEDGGATATKTVNVIVPVTLTATDIASDKASFKWTAANGATDIKILDVTSNASGDDVTPSTGIAVNSTTVTVTGLKPATSYTFRLMVTGGCNQGASNDVTITTLIDKIRLKNASSGEYVDDTTQTLNLTDNTSITVEPEISSDGATTKDIDWEYSSNNYVDIKDNGDGTITVTAKNNVPKIPAGSTAPTTQITAKAKDGSNKTAAFSVAVKQPVISINLMKDGTNQSVNNTEVVLDYTDTDNNSIIIDPKIVPTNSTTQNQDLIWTPSDSTAVSIVKNADGTGTVTVTLLKDIDQPVTITVTANDGGTASASFTIQPVEHVTGVTVNPDSATINVKDTLNIAPNVTVAPSNASNKSVTYVSDTPGVATVDATTGLVTGIATGTAIITVTTADGGRTATFTVIVKQPLKTISLGPDPLNLNLTNNTTYTGLPGELTFNPTDATDKKVTWTSADPTIATVDPVTGKVTAQSNGTTTITAKAEGVEATATKTINVIVPVTLTATDIASDKATFNWTAANGATDIKILDVTSNPKGVDVTPVGGIAVDSTTVTVTGLQPATSYTFRLMVTGGCNQGVSNDVTITTLIDKIRLKNASSDEYVEGTTQTLNLTDNNSITVEPVISSNGATIKDIDWSYSANDYVTIKNNGNGTVTATANKNISKVSDPNRTVAITAKAKDGSNKTATVYINVWQPVTDINLSSAVGNASTISIFQGSKTVSIANAYPSNAGDPSLTYSVPSDSKVAKVDKNGVITGLSPGTVKVTIQSNDNPNVPIKTITVIVKRVRLK